MKKAAFALSLRFMSATYGFSGLNVVAIFLDKSSASMASRSSSPPGSASLACPRHGKMRDKNSLHCWKFPATSKAGMSEALSILCKQACCTAVFVKSKPDRFPMEMAASKSLSHKPTTASGDNFSAMPTWVRWVCSKIMAHCNLVSLVPWLRFSRSRACRSGRMNLAPFKMACKSNCCTQYLHLSESALGSTSKSPPPVVVDITSISDLLPAIVSKFESEPSERSPSAELETAREPDLSKSMGASPTAKLPTSTTS